MAKVEPLKPAEIAANLPGPHACRPGSPEWVAREMLFTLVALCTECHDKLHQ